jgi:hypothetical protein
MPDAPNGLPQRDAWNKAQILLQPVGAIVTALLVAYLGWLTSSFLQEERVREESWQLYANLMNQREQADSTLRKDMFNSIIESFVVPRSEGATSSIEAISQEVLNLELLAYNFHDSLDLQPLFKHLGKRIAEMKARPQGASVEKELDEYEERLETLAGNIIAKQASALEEGGLSCLVTINTESTEPIAVDGIAGRVFSRLEVLSINAPEKEILIRLLVYRLDREAEAAICGEEPPADVAIEKVVDGQFWSGHFAFPMIDNVRLPDGKRGAIAQEWLNPRIAQVRLLMFPESRASLKDKPYYEEIVRALRSTDASDYP